MTTTLEDVVKQAKKLDPDTQKVVAEEWQQLIDAVQMLDAVQWQHFTAAFRHFIESALVQPRWEQLLSDPRRLDALHRQAQEVIEENGRDSAYTLGFLRGVGLDDELVAHVLAAPEEQRGRELRLALQVMVNERSGRDPLKEPRYLTFEQFFRELGHTDEEIDEAKRRAATDADL
jgi:hypothetical protein